MEILNTPFSYKENTSPDASTPPAREPVYAVEWIEKAASSFTEWYKMRFTTDKKVKVFCGIGDNGATGLVIAARLREMGYYVKVYVVQHTYPPSLAFSRFRNLIPAFKWIWVDTDMPRITDQDVIIDAILGTGLNREISHVTESVVNRLNGSGAKIVSLDIATGLFASQHTPTGAVIKPDFTVSFTLPKPAFLLQENEKYVGELSMLDIGMKPEMIQQPDDQCFVSAATIKSFFRKRSRFVTQASLGRALLIAGCNGNLGAAVLAAKACLRSGAGHLTVQVPGCGQMLLQTAVPEASIQADPHKEVISEIPDLENFSAVGFGAGIGTDGITSAIFELLLRQSRKPLILSHDAIEMLCVFRHLLYKLPKDSTLILEEGDFKRLTDSDLEIKYNNGFERTEALRKFAKRHQVNLVFKAGTVCTVTPEGKVYFNLTGNAGLASASTNDILTGIITSLAAQGYEMWQAAVMGVYLHGLAADVLSLKKGCSGWVASELLEHIGSGIRKLEN